MTDKARRSKSQAVITPQLVRDALAFIPPNIDRDMWVRVGMALKSEFGADGRELWEEWSSGAESYNAADARDTWRSIKSGGRVTIGTLFRLAQDRGFRFGAAGASAVDADSVAAELARRERERAKNREIEEAKYRASADQAARVAASDWQDAQEARVAGGYAERKGVGDHGVRYRGDGTLLVPMRDASGALHNLQRIAPRKPADGSTDKRFLSGGRKSKLWHWCGDPAEAQMLLLAEGYATAASIFEATGRPCAVAFDAGNLAHVARELRALYPNRPLLICADDDQATEQRTGENTGRRKAASAMRAAAGAPAGVALPTGHPAGTNADFNDMATSCGRDAVRQTIEAAIQALPVRPVETALEEPASNDAEAGFVEGDGDDGQTSTPRRWDPFNVTDDGVWYAPRDASGDRAKPRWICARLDVTALTRADDKNGWGRLLEFNDFDGNAKTWAMPASMLSGDGADWAARLRDMGLAMAPGPKARNLVAEYIDTRGPRARVTCTDRVGWHGSTFVLPSTSIGGADGQRYVFQSESGVEDTFRQHGTLLQWQTDVAALCEGNSRIVFAMATAFAGPLLRPAGVEGGVVHFRGDSSGGKTTCLRVACSVWGRQSFMQQWRSTANALESTAVQHCDATLILDEWGQLDAREAGDVAYLISNGQEKGRSTRHGFARKKRTWVTLVLSSGELSLAQHMESVGKSPRAGQEVRMLDIPLDAGAGMGGIEALHGLDGPAVLAETIVAAAARAYGVAGRRWLEWLCAQHSTLPARLAQLIGRYRDEMVPEAAAEQVRRAGTRFALIAAAGELATEAGITGWTAGHAAWAARRCFNAWLAARGHLDNGEESAMFRGVVRFLELNGEGRFTWYHRAANDHAPKTLNRAGFRRLITPKGKAIKSDSDHMAEYGEKIGGDDADAARVEYFVHQEVFRSEVCKGFDPNAVARMLQRRGHLEHDGDRLTIKHRIPSVGRCTCYHIRPSIFDDEF